MSQETKIIIGIAVVTIAIIGGAAFFFSKNGALSQPTQTVQTVTDSSKLILPDSYHTASDSAKVVMVEFGDYQCPSCDIEYPVIKKLVTDYQGKLELVFRNFPLPMHANAQVAAEAAEAAGAQGKYWEMHDWLYENQNNWADSSHPIDQFTQEAQTLGLNVDKFKEDVLTNAYKDRINKDMADGNALGVDATPTIYINNKLVGGLTLPSYNDLKQVINQDLAGK